MSKICFKLCFVFKISQIFFGFQFFATLDVGTNLVPIFFWCRVQIRLGFFFLVLSFGLKLGFDFFRVRVFDLKTVSRFSRFGYQVRKRFRFFWVLFFGFKTVSIFFEFQVTDKQPFSKFSLLLGFKNQFTTRFDSLINFHFTTLQ